MTGFNLKQIIMFVILGLLYFILCRCNNNGFSVGIQEHHNCNDLIKDCMNKKDCSNVDFTNCNLLNINLNNLNLSGAILKNTILSNNLEGTNLSGVQWDGHTIWGTKCNGDTILPPPITYEIDGISNIGSAHCNYDQNTEKYVLDVNINAMEPPQLSKYCGEKHCKEGDLCCHKDTCCNMKDGCGVIYGCGIFKEL